MGARAGFLHQCLAAHLPPPPPSVTPRAPPQTLGISGLLAYVLACSLALSLLAFTALHSWLISHGSTTLEMQIYPSVSKNPYNLGTARNWRAVMGSEAWMWFVPVVSPNAGSGLAFPHAFTPPALPARRR